jgi:hypothetical protein
VPTIIDYLQAGITLTTPIFFFIVLIALLKTLRTTDLCLKTTLHIIRKIDKKDKEENRAGMARAQAQLSQSAGEPDEGGRRYTISDEEQEV